MYNSIIFTSIPILNLGNIDGATDTEKDLRTLNLVFAICNKKECHEFKLLDTGGIGQPAATQQLWHFQSSAVNIGQTARGYRH